MTITFGQEIYVNKQVFTLGQDVQVKNGTFTGTIVGVDYMTGRLVCCSHKISSYKNDRTRYCYGADELEPYVSTEPMTKFKVGHHYKIDKRQYVAVLNDCNPACVDLKSTDGVVTLHAVPRNIETRKLKHEFGIVVK